MKHPTVFMQEPARESWIHEGREPTVSRRLPMIT
jgi:hypothetical protein